MSQNYSPFLIASWLNLILYTTAHALYGIYIHRFPRDRKIHRVLVHSALVSDTICTIAVCARAYMVLLDPFKPPSAPWVLPMIIIANALSSAFEHTFLTYRIWHLKTFESSLTSHPVPTFRRVCWPSVFLLFLTFSHLLLSTSSAIMSGIDYKGNRRLSVTSAMVGGVLRATTDILIALILVYQVNTFESLFLTTQSFLRRFTMRVLSTGILAAIIALLIVILLALDQPVVTVFTSVIGRLHSITMLSHLCCRKDIVPLIRGGVTHDLETRIDIRSPDKDGSNG